MIDYDYGVKLRRLDDSDAKTIFDWRNNAEIYSWCRQNAPLHYSNHLQWMQNQCKDQTIEMFGIVANDKVTNLPTLVGVCGLTSIDYINRRAEFSLYIAPEQQGQEFGREALRTLVRWGLDSLNLNRIWGESYQGNEAVKIFEKIGFVKEGERIDFYFRNSKYVNALLYSVGPTSFNR